MSEIAFQPRVSRRPQLRSLLDQQRTLGNRAVLRLIGLHPEPAAPEPPVEPSPPATPPPPEPHLPPPPKRRWFLGVGVLALLAAIEAARRWFGG